MKILTDQTVYEAALDRIRWLYDEFDTVVVAFSGGKDSTVVLNLTLQVARERGLTPVPVLFIDQEAEWQSTIDYVEQVMAGNPDVKPYWYQMPMVITNNASSYDRYSFCWDPANESGWIHDKHPVSIKENSYGTDRFHELFNAIIKKDFGRKTCLVGGMRTEETPKRFSSLTSNPTYKWVTWGKILNKGLDQYTFYPIYDWTYRDVWKYIHDHGVSYNKIYDEMYRYGHSIMDMRVSNLHHETAVQHLQTIQELEPQTWNKIAARIKGANTIKQIKSKAYTCPKDLPPMFTTWEEYALHLADNIIQDETRKQQLQAKIESYWWIKEGNETGVKDFFKVVIKTILSSDWDFSKIANFWASPATDCLRRIVFNPDGSGAKAAWTRRMTWSNDYLTNEQNQKLIKYWNELETNA